MIVGTSANLAFATSGKIGEINVTIISQDSTTTGTPKRGAGMARMFIDPLIKLLEERAAG